MEKPRTQAERRAASESKLLRAAAELVAEGGVAAATFERIGERAGLSRGLVTQRFGSKEGLIHALVEDVAERFDAFLFAHHVDTLPPDEALLAFIEIYLSDTEDAAIRDTYHVLLAESLATQPTLRPLFSRVHDGVRERLRTLLENGQEAGTISRSLDPDVMAVSVGAFLLGIRIQRMINPTTDIDAIRKTAIASLRTLLGSGNS